jgi:uncharacterized protein YbjT (DUF2867 family)
LIVVVDGNRDTNDGICPPTPSLRTTHTLLESGRYRVRALTRNADSPQAKSLESQGAELLAVPLELGRKKELVAAFAGSQGVFLMTAHRAAGHARDGAWQGAS